MSNFLDKIVADKKARVEELMQRCSLEILANQARGHRGLSLIDALLCDSVNIIAEIKRASPSQGDICMDVDVAKQAIIYETAGAKAISVLTEEKYFKGSANDLLKVKDNVSIPVLRKDFTISEYQIIESAALGADVILLIVRILNDEQLAKYIALAKEYGLESLVEVYDKDDLMRAKKAGAKLIGINNRNLSSFDVDIANSIEMVELLDDDMVAIAASGIFGRNDIQRNLEAGLHNFLVGQSIMEAKNPETFIRELINAQ
ncbi:MAG: indole-3-glycerol phosphate synthase TrpC [Phycisphaerae bacterium]|nr:indole-3-glycerol phosphate synthase TrpC [Phycisphaerae bacterium]